MNKRQRHAKYLERKDRRQPPPAQIDLIAWVKMRSNLSTRKAKAVIMAGALKADSHTLGVKQFTVRDTTHKTFIRYVPADLVGRIQVVTPEGMK